jgi:hypothetical protein
MDEDNCEAIGGMIGRRNRSTVRKPVSESLCPPQIPHDLTRVRTRVAAVRSRELRHGLRGILLCVLGVYSLICA